MRGRRGSIIWRVTIWYSAFLCLLAVVVVSMTLVISSSLLRKNSKDMVKTQVEHAFEEVEYDDGELELDEDLDFMTNGVYLSVYEESGEKIAGVRPTQYTGETEIEQGTVTTVSEAGTTWYVYKRTGQVEGGYAVTIEGIARADVAGGSSLLTVRTVFLMLPGIILVAIIGGYLMTKRAFAPVKRIRETVDEIAGGKDLTKRVNLGQGKDELYELGRTFDAMFVRLEEAFLREKQFTSDVSHELRTPISVILSQTEYASRQENPKGTKEALEVIHRQTLKISKLISQLLMLSRMEEGVEKLNREHLDVSELLEVTVEEAQEKAEEKGLVITTAIQEDIWMEGDETLLLRLFVNLLSNAVKYTNEGGSIHVSLHEEGGMAVGSVKDTGIGISASEIDKIWKRFYQVDSARTSNEEGNMGLGLSMVKWIVKAHHGTIGVKSRLGEGTTFTFRLPKK